MEFILDTADAGAVRDLSEVMTIAGVTTNPTIITRSGKTPEQVFSEMDAVLAPEQKLFMQTVATDYEGILADARKICSLRKNMYVKIPVTHDGMRAIKQAKREGLDVLATAIYSPDQAFFAAMNGADYLAPTSTACATTATVCSGSASCRRCSSSTSSPARSAPPRSRTATRCTS